MRSLVGLLALTALLSPSFARAGAAPVGFELRASSEHFTFYGRQGSPPPDVERTERYLSKIEGILGKQVAGTAPYYLVDHPVQVKALTGLYAQGVTRLGDGTIYSVHGFHPHEVVHRVAAELGDPGPLFHEGLAVALADRGQVEGKRVDAEARRVLRRRPFSDYLLRFRDQNPRDAYAVAGSFVGFLLERHGAGAVADFFRACSGQGQPHPKAFADVFGQTLDAAVREWQQRIRA